MPRSGDNLLEVALSNLASRWKEEGADAFARARPLRTGDDEDVPADPGKAWECGHGEGMSSAYDAASRELAEVVEAIRRDRSAGA